MRVIEATVGRKCFTLANRGKEIIERSLQVEQKDKTKGACKHPKSGDLICIVTIGHFFYVLVQIYSRTKETREEAPCR